MYHVNSFSQMVLYRERSIGDNGDNNYDNDDNDDNDMFEIKITRNHIQTNAHFIC